MKISVHSRPAVEALDPPEEPHIIVSINCPGEEPARIRSNRATLGRTNLFFWDLDRLPEHVMDDETIVWQGGRKLLPDIKEEHLCQASDAKLVIDLVEAHPEAERIIIHCTAGKSRSAAVAAALHKVLNGTDEPIFRDKRYSPNMRVYRALLEEWYDRYPVG